MCDEFTAADAARVTRRTFTALGGAAAVIGMNPANARSAGQGAALSETKVSIPTANGHADAIFLHPVHGTHPGIVMWPDIAGLRDAYKIMARRLAVAGYAVLAVNQYYRGGAAPLLSSFAQWRTPEGQAKLAPLIAALTPGAVTSDAAAYVHFLDQQPAVDRQRHIGSVGYCMGGPFAVRTAAAVPARIGAVATLHGASLVTDKPDSPHRLIAATQARYLFAIARGDDARAPGDKDALRAAAAAAHRPAEVEVYPAEHGWCTIDAPVYDHAQADRAYNRELALFAAL
ncbi:MAG: dienelactone hydrolase family protein [Pseudomonadota bacterium]|nr:dienelactone hydrolase family protein [Pseudomonadota bacterium]